MRFRPISLILLTFLLAPLHAEPAPASLEKRVVEHTLRNGIKLLIVERHFSPTVSIRMMFKTGSVEETAGKTGLAHMFEHMMFKGTRTLGTRDYAAEAPFLKRIEQLHLAIDNEKSKGAAADQKKIGELIDQVRIEEEKAHAYVTDNELWNLYEKEGASLLNATTGRDFTSYIVDLPSNKLELWALLDSDRLKNPVFRQFYQEREVVKEERRMRVDTNPQGKLYEEFIATAFRSHPYRNPTIGWETDLDHLDMSDLTDFYNRFYTPDALTIAIVGDVSAPKTIAMVERYFGDWKTPPGVRHAIPAEPAQTGLRKTSITFDAQASVVVGFHIPGPEHPDQTVSYAVAYLLGSGTSSRLYKTLVEKKKVATSVSTGQNYPGERYGSLFIIETTIRFPKTADDCVRLVESELDRLKNVSVSEWELEKVRSSVEVMYLNALQTNSGMAEALVETQTVFGDWREIMSFQKRIQSLSAADIQNFAKRYFVKDNETIAVLETAKKK